MKHFVYGATLFGVLITFAVALSSESTPQSLYFLNCYWHIPDDFRLAEDGRSYYSRYRAGRLSSIRFSEEPFDPLSLKSSLIDNVEEFGYGNLRVYSYTYDDAGENKLGVEGVKFPMITVSNGSNYIAFSNLSDGEFERIGRDCLSK